MEVRERNETEWRRRRRLMNKNRVAGKLSWRRRRWARRFSWWTRGRALLPVASSNILVLYCLCPCCYQRNYNADTLSDNIILWYLKLIMLGNGFLDPMLNTRCQFSRSNSNCMYDIVITSSNLSSYHCVTSFNCFSTKINLWYYY